MAYRDVGFEGGKKNKTKEAEFVEWESLSTYSNTLLRPDGAAENLEILLCDAEMFMVLHLKQARKICSI